MKGDWNDLNRRLTGAALALDLGDSLVVGEYEEQPKRRFRATPEPILRRFVRVTAGQSALVGECIGSTTFGGAWEMSSETEAALIAQGWEKPWSEEMTTFTRDVPLARAPHLALAMVRALQVLGCEMADLDVRLVRDEEIAGG